MESLKEKSDETLVRLTQKGNNQAFSILVDRYSDAILRYGRKFIGSREDIEDRAQTVFLKAYESINSFNLKKRFSPWIYRIAHNEFVNALRQNKRNKVFSLDTFLPYLSKENEVEREIDRDEIKRLINSSLGRLEEKYLEPLILFYFEDLSYEEISDVMRIPISTVGVRLRRGRRRLKEYLEDEL